MQIMRPYWIEEFTGNVEQEDGCLLVDASCELSVAQIFVGSHR